MGAGRAARRPGRQGGAEGRQARSRASRRATFTDGGDIITKIDDRKIDTPDDLSEAVQLFDPGQKVKVEVYRDGKKRDLDLTLGERPLNPPRNSDG